MQYEIFYLVGNSLESELAKIKKEVEEIITSFDGKFLEKATEEKRRLSYQVKHETHGIYIARRFDLSNKKNIQKITTKLNLNNKILRFVLSKADELPALKSKEERIAEANQKEAKIEQKIEQKDKKERQKESNNKEETLSTNGTTKEETSIQKKTSSKTTTTDESIDKKLEEILNI